jgi:hypothetical protein
VIYEWKPDARYSANPQVVGERLEAIRVAHGGDLHPADVVEDARADASPLHPLFQWDDNIAAEEYRKEQARHIIRHITVVFERPPAKAKTVRAFVSIQRQEETAYTSVQEAMSHADLRAQVVKQAWRELQGWRQRYQDLQELASIFAAMDDAGASLLD